MRKDICDLCGGDLKVWGHPPEETGIIAGWYKFFVCRVPKIKEIRFFRDILIPPFVSPFSKKEIEICSKCFDDFKEFIQRKKSFLSQR